LGRRRKLPFYEKVEITAIAAEGKALARVNDIVVFVPNVIPGDIVDIQIVKKKKSYQEGKAVTFHVYSSLREKPFCSHFGICGGCKWQILPYSEQLKFKQQQVEDNFVRLGKFEIPEVLPILGSAKTEYYRNKLEFTFSNKRWLTQEDIDTQKEINDPNALGFHVPGRFDKIIDVEKCYLQADPSNDIRNFVKEYTVHKAYTFFDLREQHGLMRNIIIRTSTTEELMVIVIFFENKKEEINDVMEAVKNKFPEITSLQYIINEKKNDTITDQEVICYNGKDFIQEEMEGLKFKIGPKSFFQTNSVQAYELYKVARNYAGLTGNEIVYDLYTGTGTIANFVAKEAQKVVGIEYVPEAIEDAKLNSEQNNIDNTVFYAGDMKDILTASFIAENGQPDIIITDPPRAGMHKDVVDTILQCAPEKIVYVSCNPATQARDIQLMSEHYSVEKIQPVDMFPHTHHVENVVLMKKR